MNEHLQKIIFRYKSNRESVYNTWFVNNEERLKAFRSIRRGVMSVVDEIKNKTFENDFKGSSLEFVLTCITEQKQIFVGAAHPFYWKPKLRIPDIYENETNNRHKAELSNDLGAIVGLLFEIGAQKLILGNDEYLSEQERKKIEKLSEKRQEEIQEEKREENLHTEMQYHLLKIGKVLGYDVCSATNDKTKSHNGKNFSFLCLPDFPKINTDTETAKTIKLIDVLWYQKGTDNVIAAFEVEKSTSIYSGILRLLDLSYSIADGDEAFYLIVPDKREKDVQLQLSRPSIKNNKVPIKYILFSELRQNCDALCKFGDNYRVMEKISKTV